MPVKLVIFDLDGTLIDAYGAIVNSFNYTMRRLSFPSQSALAIKKAVGWGDENLLKPFIPGSVLKKALSIYRAHHKTALLEDSKLMPHAQRLLSRLKKHGVKLAVASNRPTKFSLILLRHLKIKKYFDYCLCADKLKFGKPHPEILNKIIKIMGVKKSQAFYVGDMAIDAEAGRRAGIKTIVVLGGSSSELEIKREKPFRVLRGLSGISFN